MKNTELAVELMINYLESEGISLDTKSATKAVNKWSNRLGDIDFISLAAVAISDPNELVLTEKEIRNFREFYFPSKNIIERNLF